MPTGMVDEFMFGTLPVHEGDSLRALEERDFHVAGQSIAHDLF